jgi:hypothetical protein
MRNGIGCALLLAMGTPLSLALIKTFQTMLSLKLESVDIAPARQPHRPAHARLHRFCRQGHRPRLSAHEFQPAKAIAAGILGLNPRN